MSSRPASLSPPPLKRRRVETPRKATPTPLPSPTPNLHQPPVKRPTSLRIFSWNINGIAPYADSQRPITAFFPASTTTSTPRNPPPDPRFPSLRACLHRWSFPHLICLQEVKIAPLDISSQASLRRTINTPLNDNDPAIEPHRLYDAHFCLPRDKHNATGFSGKVYGVCTLIRRDIVTSSSTKTVDWDLEGRVLLTELPDHGIVVFNIYAVNGTTNPYRDPADGKVIGDRHMRKRIFHGELRDECARYEAQGWHVMIVGDMNISQTPGDSYPQLRMGKEHVVNRAHFRDCFMRGKADGGLGMRDTFREVRGEERKFSYRPRGRVWGEGMDRVDLILVSQGMRVKGADILDEELERGRSDHVPLMVEVDVGDDDQEGKEGIVKGEDNGPGEAEGEQKDEDEMG
ncbi:MAG: hypothetical protein Q9188_002167 [Gyalolechia gomerana]